MSLRPKLDTVSLRSQDQKIVKSYDGEVLLRPSVESSSELCPSTFYRLRGNVVRRWTEGNGVKTYLVYGVRSDPFISGRWVRETGDERKWMCVPEIVKTSVFF